MIHQLKNIITGCKNKEPFYQRILVEQYSARLLTTCRRYLSIQADAQDLLQDSFIQIFKVIEQFDPSKGSFESWINRIAINTVLKHHRKQKIRLQELPEDELNESILLPNIYSTLEVEDLINLIRSLPNEYRQVFNMSVIEGYSHKEIAQLMDFEESTSRSHLHRARKMLQEKIISREKKEKWNRTSSINL